MNDDLYQQLEEALSRFAKQPSIDYGFLGYDTGTGYSVIVPNNPHLYRVVLDDGSYVELPHLGRVPPIPSARVLISYDELQKPYIVGLDNKWILEYNKNVAAVANIGLHSHHRGSGMEFPIDWRLLMQLGPRIVEKTLIQIVGGFFYYKGLRYLPTSTINVQPFIPSASQQRWVIVSIDATTNPPSIVMTPTTPVSTFFTLDVATIASSYTSVKGHLPLFAVRLLWNAKQVVDQDIVSLYHIVGSGGADNKEDILDSIVTSGGDVVVDNVTGNVVYI